MERAASTRDVTAVAASALPESRRLPLGWRYASVGCRTLHGAAVVLLIGAVIRGEPSGPWAAAVLLSGLALAGFDLWRSGRHVFRYVQGAMLLVKVALVAVGIIWPPSMPWMLWLAFAIGSIVAHGPGSLRHRALWGPPGPCARDRCSAL